MILQRFQLDRRRKATYLRGRLILGLVVGGCYPAALGNVVPVDIAPVTDAQVAEWVNSTVPREARLFRFKWLFQDERASAGGRGSARLAPPDSLRFDAAGPFGAEPMAAVVIGDGPRWVQPANALEKFVPNYPLFWAMFGVARRPEAGTALRGIEIGESIAWQYARGADTVEYRYTRGRPSMLLAEVRHAGTVVGRAETKIGPSGAPLAAKLVMPTVYAKLDLTFTSTERTTIAPDLWLHRP